jgi:hypothetical protein
LPNPECKAIYKNIYNSPATIKTSQLNLIEIEGNLLKFLGVTAGGDFDSCVDRSQWAILVRNMLSKLLNEAALEDLAGERAFDRGADYFADGHVAGLKEDKGAITARVRGTHDYRVKLWSEDGELAFECNCPVGQDSVFLMKLLDAEGW